MLKIWGRDNSVNVQKVLWACREMDLPYERVDAGGPFGIVGEASYKALNPNSRVPTIEDNGFVLWESNACVRYLTSKHDVGGLWPSDVVERADADRWMDWQQTVVWPVLRPGFWTLIRTPEPERDPKVIEQSRTDSAAAFAILDRYLEGRDFVAGDRFTMGDIPLGCAVQRWFNLPWERPAQPNVEAWYARLRARPAFAEIVDKPLT